MNKRTYFPSEEPDRWNMTSFDVHYCGDIDLLIPIFILEWYLIGGRHSIEIWATPRFGNTELRTHWDPDGEWHQFSNFKDLQTALEKIKKDHPRFPLFPTPPHLKEIFADTLEAKSVIFGKRSKSEKELAMKKLSEKWEKLIPGE